MRRRHAAEKRVASRGTVAAATLPVLSRVLRLGAASMVLGYAAPAAAEDAVLRAYVAEVAAKNPSIRARAQRTRAASEEALAAGRWPDPRVSVMVDRVPSSGMTAQTMPPMLQYSVQQMVPWPGKLGLMRDAAGAQVTQSASDVETRKLDLALEAKRAYWMLALNVRRREVNRASRDVAATLASATLGRYSAGIGGHHDVARAQVEIAALDVQYIDLEGERGSTLAMINALRNELPDKAFPQPERPRSDVEPLDRGRLAEQALARRPELRGMRAMETEATTMAAVERRERYPDLMSGLWYNQMIGMPDSGGAMLGATIPVFGYARQTHRAAAFVARAESASEEQAAMRAMIRYEVADAIIAVETASRQIDLVSNVALPRARESFQSSLASFGSGATDIVGVLDARRSLQQAELALAEAETKRELAIAQLERALGSVGGLR